MKADEGDSRLLEPQIPSRNNVNLPWRMMTTSQTSQSCKFNVWHTKKQDDTSENQQNNKKPTDLQRLKILNLTYTFK